MSRDISPSKEALSNRNLTLLLDTLSKKETQKSLEALAKIDKDEWKSMAEATTMLNSFVSLGGTSELVTTLTSSVKETVKLQIESVLSPLTNEINQQITNILSPFINDILTPMINDLTTFLSENKTGAGAGGIIGGVIGKFTPLGPVVGGIVGAVVGALIESGYNSLDEAVQATSGLPYSPDIKTQYEQETGNIFISIFDWDYINWFQNRVIPSGDFVGGSGRRIGGLQEGF